MPVPPTTHAGFSLSRACEAVWPVKMSRVFSLCHHQDYVSSGNGKFKIKCMSVALERVALRVCDWIDRDTPTGHLRLYIPLVCAQCVGWR